VLSMFSVVQSVLLVGALALAIRFPGPQSETIPLMMATALLTSLAGMAMGLFISAFSRNSDQAMILVPLLLIPQIVYAGVAIPLQKLPDIGAVIAEFMVSKWSVELMGSIAEIEPRLAAQTNTGITTFLQVKTAALDTGFEGAFTMESVWRWLVLAGFSVFFILATLVLQWRKGRF